MSQQWFYSREGQQQGPVSPEELKRLAATGKLQPTDLVWKEGMSQWVTASSIKGLFAVPQAPPPVPSLPAVPPTGTAAPATSHLSSGGTVAQPTVRPFGEWYRTTWVGQKPVAVQIIVWLVWGFLWIPYWYFWTATPSGSLRGKWAALGRGGQVAYAVLTGFLCLLAMRAVTHRPETAGRPPNHLAVSNSPALPPITTNTPAKANTPTAESVTSSMADGPVPLNETLRNQLVKPFTPEGGIDPAVTSWTSLADHKLRISCASAQCIGSFDPEQKVYDAFVHTSDGKVMLVQFSGDYVPSTGKLSDRDERTIRTLLGNVVGMFPNNADVDFTAVRKMVFGDVVSLVSNGVRKNVGRAILIAVLANGKLTITVAIDPKHTEGVLTAEMLDQVTHQDFRVIQTRQ